MLRNEGRIGDRFNPWNRFKSIFVIPEPVMLSPLSPGAKLTYCVLCRYAGQDANCYPSARTIAGRIGISAVMSGTMLMNWSAKDTSRATEAAVADRIEITSCGVPNFLRSSVMMGKIVPVLTGTVVPLLIGTTLPPKRITQKRVI